jgi:hypothetical protein
MPCGNAGGSDSARPATNNDQIVIKHVCFLAMFSTLPDCV